IVEMRRPGSRELRSTQLKRAVHAIVAERLGEKIAAHAADAARVELLVAHQRLVGDLAVDARIQARVLVPGLRARQVPLEDEEVAVGLEALVLELALVAAESAEREFHAGGILPAAASVGARAVVGGAERPVADRRLRGGVA